MKIALWRAISGLALVGSLVVTPPAVGYAVEALRAEPGVESSGDVTRLRRDDNDNDWESNDDNDNADEAAAPVAPEGVDPNPSNNDPNNNGDQSGGGGDTSGSQP